MQRNAINLSAELWTTADIAAFLRLSIRQARDRITKLPSFPKPRIIGGSKRWVAAEVREWAGVN